MNDKPKEADVERADKQEFQESELVQQAMAMAQAYFKEVNLNCQDVPLPTHFCFACQTFFTTLFNESALRQAGCPRCRATQGLVKLSQ